MTQVKSEADVRAASRKLGWPMPKCILAAVDGSPQSRWAERVAETLGAGFGAEVRLVYVVDPETQPGELCELVRDGKQFLADFPVDGCGGKPVGRLFRIGRPAEEIVSAANDWTADLIVMGTHGLTGIDHFLVGSVAESVLRRAACPVLCVKREPRHPTTLSRILVAVDDSEQSAWAAELAASMARISGAQVALGHVAPLAAPIEPGYAMFTDRADEALLQAGKDVLSRFFWPQDVAPAARFVRQGPAAQEILELAREWKADLIVIGTHARHGLSRLLLGSTAETVLRRSECPVLCVSHRPSTSADSR